MHNEENCFEAEYFNLLGGLGEKGDWGSGLPPHVGIYVNVCTDIIVYIHMYIHT